MNTINKQNKQTAGQLGHVENYLSNTSVLVTERMMFSMCCCCTC